MAMPPSSGPNTGASTTPMPKMPMAVPRRSGGKIWKFTIIDSGCMTPAGMPCMMRETISISMLVENAPIAVAARKRETITIKVRRRPSAATSQLFSSMPMTMVAR